MPIYRQGDVVKVPFPYTDRATRQRRPALVISTGQLDDHDRLLWVVMITSAENSPWPGDIPVVSGSATGLSAPSVIRTSKIATIETLDAELIGQIPAVLVSQVVASIAGRIGAQQTSL